jgi:hypothetical protein
MCIPFNGKNGQTNVGKTDAERKRKRNREEVSKALLIKQQK